MKDDRWKEFSESEIVVVPEKPKEKKGLFSRITGAFKRVFFPVNVDEFDINERAGDFNMSMSELSRSYDDVRRASLLCEKALKIAGSRADLASKQQMLKDKLNELQKFEVMTDEEKTYITNVFKKYKDVTREKGSLRGQMSSFTKILDYLEPYEKDVAASIAAMDEAEDKQRRVKQDMNYLEGEKSELGFQKQSLEGTLVIIYRIAAGVTAAFTAIAAGLLYLYFSRGIEIFLYAFYCAVALIIITTLLYIYRRRVIFEDKLNVMLQIRAVELLNRKKVLYVHYTSFLNYEYKKYRVKSAYELKEVWKEYDYYKHVSARYDNIRNIGYAIEDEIADFLKRNGLSNTRTSVDNLSKILDFENNKRQYRRFSSQLEFVEAKLSRLEDEQKEAWDELIALKDRDVTKDKTIERMMNEYFEDVSRVLPHADEADDFNYNYDEE